MNQRQLLLRLINGRVQNVHFADFVVLVESFGFRLSRTAGSHQIFVHPHVDEVLNLQEIKGEVKPYQIRQFLRLTERYNLKLEE